MISTVIFRNYYRYACTTSTAEFFYQLLRMNKRANNMAIVIRFPEMIIWIQRKYVRKLPEMEDMFYRVPE